MGDVDQRDGTGQDQEKVLLSLYAARQSVEAAYLNRLGVDRAGFVMHSEVQLEKLSAEVALCIKC